LEDELFGGETPFSKAMERVRTLEAWNAKLVSWFETIAAMPCCVPSGGKQFGPENECKACQAGLAAHYAKELK
jgi:CO dehydrogenase/acetyl-CoA synthase alpha subunit